MISESVPSDSKFKIGKKHRKQVYCCVRNISMKRTSIVVPVAVVVVVVPPRIKVLPGKLTGPHLVKKFPAFYRPRRFIIAFTSSRPIHSNPVYASPVHFLKD